MSHSPAHDALIEPVAEYLRINEQTRSALVEPGRPRDWFCSCPWPAVDLFAVHTWKRTFAVDVKVSIEDCRAQLDKPYITNPGLCVGNQRYIAVPASLEGPIPVPDGWGILTVDDAGNVVETAEAWRFKHERSWVAEAVMGRLEWDQFGNVSTGNSAVKKKGVHAKRGMVDDAIALLDAVPVPLGRLANELDTTPAKLGKALKGDKRVEVETIFGKTQVRRSEETASA